MNRRDYLIAMGAAAGAMAAGRLDLLAHDRLETAGHARSTVQDEIYVTSGIDMYDLRRTQAVKLVFHGLMGFKLNTRQDECVVGFHSKPTLRHKHRLSVMAFKNYQPEGGEKEVPAGAKPVLEVKEPKLISGVKFYQPPLADYHPSDFRYVIDLEGPNWYAPRRFDWKSDVYKPQMTIKNGLFYTLLKTNSTFKKQPQGASPSSAGDHIGSIASYVAVNIYLQPTGSVSLKIPEAGIDLLFKGQEANPGNEIHFDNGCFKRLSGNKCKFDDPQDSDETDRNDFYMHRDAVELGAGVKYQLVREDVRTTAPAPDICGHHLLSDAELTATDEAPCSALAYGYGGWPSYPEL